MAERLFTPWSLARVAEAVEWEDVLEYRRDGSSNQAQFMKAMSILWERWMREWQLPDFANVLTEVRDRDWIGVFEVSIKGLQNRVQQLVGFYQGLWAGANPGWRRAFWFPPGVLPVALTTEERARNALAAMVADFTILFGVTEEEEGE